MAAQALDWSGFERSEKAAHDEGWTQWQVHQEIRRLVRALGDQHSSFETPDRVVQSERSQGPAFPPEFQVLRPDTALISMPPYRGTNEELIDAFVAHYRKQVAELAARGVTRWVIDLRKNEGGNMWPMLSALRPFLGSAPVGGVREKTEEIRWWSIDARGSADDLTNHAVAILQGRRTASSGEAVAVAFRGRPRSRSFGAHTSGRSTANSSYSLADGSRLHLTTAIFVDRNGTPYPDGVEPNIPASDDAVVEEAVQWLATETRP